MSLHRVAAFSVHTSPLAQPGRGDSGGMNVYVRSLMAALSRAGVRCDVFTRREDPDVAQVVELEPGIRVVHIDAGPASEIDKESLPPLLDVFSDRCREWIETNGERYDVLHAHYWMSGVVAHRLKHELGLPLMTTFHTLDLVKLAAGVQDEFLNRAATERSIIACADLMIASTPDEERDLIVGYDADPARIEIVAPGVDHALFHPRGRDESKRRLGYTGVEVVLFAGRIQPLKGGELAVRAFQELGRDNAKLLMVGDPSGPSGPAELARLRLLAHELGIEQQVEFVGSVAHDELAHYYRAADVCIVPSHSESFGLVALEASSCGTPVVAASVGGLRSIVDDGRTGFLVEGRSPTDFAACIDKILSDPVYAAALGARGAARSEQFSWNTTAVRLRRAYGDLAAREPVQCR